MVVARIVGPPVLAPSTSGCKHAQYRLEEAEFLKLICVLSVHAIEEFFTFSYVVCVIDFPDCFQHV